MDTEVKEKISILIKNIDDVQECIECSNFELMDKYIEIFLMNYTKALVGIINYVKNSDGENSTSYWISTTDRILECCKSKDVFTIMDVLYFGLRKDLFRLVDNK